MATATVTETLLSTVIHSATSSAATATSTSRAPAQGGVIEGLNPSKFNPKDPIILFIIQASIILTLCRLLEWPLSKFRQPRVISEVIGGILLGPTAMGRIPGFTKHIFPTEGMPTLTLIANIGLVLFLFLVGLEVDLRFLSKNWKVALSVSALGMTLPFGLGVAIAWGLYNQFDDEPNLVPISFGVFALFIGIAMAITAFPVLCRILTELDLLHTPVGLITLAAGVGNDVVGWILLALCVTLVNAGSGLTTLYIILATLGFILFAAFAVRPALMIFLRRSRALSDGPSQGVIAITLLMALSFAFFTGIIGVHPIFGAFIAGLICPHEGGFNIKVTEKVEDLISAVFLPLYFTLSGLNTNIALLDNGITWGYVIGVIAVAFVAKFTGGTLAARACGMLWRESSTIGALMSCKGLVELIVLNIGLQARILSVRTFTIFVVMALVTTFATTPLTSYLYPLWYQRKVEAWKRGEIDWDTGLAVATSEGSIDSTAAAKDNLKIKSMLVYLRLDNMPSLIALLSLFGGKSSSIGALHPSKVSAEKDPQDTSNRPVEVHGLRLMELTDRGSSVMKVSEMDEYSAHDPVINTFRTVGRLNNLAVSGEVAIGPETSFADMLTSKASNEDSDLLLLPWSETGGMHELQMISHESEQANLASTTYTAFALRALDSAICTTALFIDHGFGGGPPRTRPSIKRTLSSLSLRSTTSHNVTTPASDKGHHIFAPFFGGADGRAALRLVLQLAENPTITATLVYYESTSAAIEFEPETPGAASLTSPTSDPTSNAVKTTATATATATQQPNRERDAAFFTGLTRGLRDELKGRVLFETVVADTAASAVVQGAVERAKCEVGQNPRNGGDLVVLGRNRGWFGPGSSGALGAVAEGIVASGVKASLLVVQGRKE